jgi:ribosomal protein S18 acetylase RimI-like enzyme
MRNVQSTTTVPIVIRQASMADRDNCAAVERRCFPPAEAADPGSISRRIRVFPQGFLVALQGDRIVGMVNSAATHKQDICDEAFKKMVGHDPDGGNMVIFSLAVLPECRRMGIARQLLTTFRQQSQAMQKSRILLICKSDLIDFYTKCGFRYGGVSASTHGGAQWHEMILSVGG